MTASPLPDDIIAAIDRLVDAAERASMLTDRRTASLRINARTAARAALEAAIAALPGGVNVKPLVWEWIGPDWRALDPWAESYTITMEDDGYLLIHDCLISHDVFATLDLAQAAAQADYEARIMSALLPPVSA